MYRATPFKVRWEKVDYCPTLTKICLKKIVIKLLNFYVLCEIPVKYTRVMLSLNNGMYCMDFRTSYGKY